MYGNIWERALDKEAVSTREPDEDKVMDLPSAVERLIRPGMHLHVAHAYLRPNAALYEICRRFWRKNPGFTISSLGFTANMVLLVYGGLARRLVTAFCGDSYPFPGPNRVYQEAYRDGKVEIENWTVLTLPLRLMAGALGIDVIPTFSLEGSTMAEENADSYFTVDVPGHGKTGMLRALRPDLVLLHAPAADRAGNVMLTPPYAENAYSAFAAREGVLVTVERVVPSSYVRRQSHLVRIPGYLVRAVCEAPLGAHPSGLSCRDLEGVEPYAEDEDFMEALRRACRNDAELEKWVDEWLFGVRDHREYLAKLGHERIWFLKGRAAEDSWWYELLSRMEQMERGPVYTPTELMVVEAARLLRKKVRENGYRTILAGIGASNLAAWKAWYDLRREGNPAELVAEVGFYGYTPRPADPFIFNLRNIPTCLMLADIPTILGSVVGANGSRSIGSLGAGQVDRFGNINSTAVPEFRLFLVGSGGACDVALGAAESVVTVAQDRLRTPEKVSYVTAPGKRVRTVVTTMGVWEKPPGEEGLVLTAYFPHLGGEKEAVEKIRESCGWEFRAAPRLRRVDEPTQEELADVRIFDPRRFFLGEG